MMRRYMEYVLWMFLGGNLVNALWHYEYLPHPNSEPHHSLLAVLFFVVLLTVYDPNR